MKKYFLKVTLLLFLILSGKIIFAQSNSDATFQIFWEDFKSAYNNKDIDKIESITHYSVDQGGFFSINATSKSDFMHNVRKYIFNNLWSAAINDAVLNKIIPITEIVDAKLYRDFGNGNEDVVYLLDVNEQALVFREINGNYFIVAMFYSGGGD